MSGVKSLRIPESLLKTIREPARRERLGESTAIRKLIAMGAAEYAVQLYRDGKITLREAAAMAETTLREMIEILLDHGVKGNVTVTRPGRLWTMSWPLRTARTRQSIHDATTRAKFK